MPYRLSAFADEISPDIQVQMDHLLDNGIRLVTLRGANRKNVLDFEEFQVPLIKQQFFNRGLKFSAIGSPIGKVSIEEPLEKELARLKTAILRAQQFETKVIRVFSFYLPEGKNPADYRNKVMDGLRAFAETAQAAGINLLHENEKKIYGDTAARCLDIMETIQAPNLRLTFDFANFVEIGEDPRTGWPKLKPWVREFHIKDAKAADKTIVPAGEGDGGLAEILKDAMASGWNGLLTLEPHLHAAGPLSGFSGPQLFKTAAAALKKVLTDIGAA
jgi:sugar phosphate isomerase/epimerase